MARQIGLNPMVGTVGNVVYYKSPYGFLSRSKGSLNKERLKNEASFARTRESGNEFGKAVAAGKVMRMAVAHCDHMAGNGKTHYRLNKALAEIARMDAVHGRGERILMPENMHNLVGFDWNDKHLLSQALKVPYEVNLDANGDFGISSSPFVPGEGLVWAGGATHAQIIAVGISMKVGTEEFAAVPVMSGMIAVDDAELNIALAANVPAEEGRILIVALGVQMFQQVGGKMARLVNGGGFGIVGAR